MKKQIHHVLAKTPLYIRVVSLYVAVGLMAGIYFYVAPQVRAINTVTNPVAVYAAPPQADTEEVSSKSKYGDLSELPRKIELPRIGLVRDVIDGYYDADTQNWTLTDDKVQYASMTAHINNTAGQTVLYGHNTSAVLEPVRSVEKGDELFVTTADGHLFVYTYSHDRFVYPTDASVIYETPDTSRVVLMTCEGWFSTTRRLLYFDFKEIR